MKASKILGMMGWLVFACSTWSVSAQTLYTPGGTIGTSGNGNVGIGVATPVAKLDVAGPVHFGAGADNVSNTTNGFSLQDSAGNNVALAVGKNTGRSTGLIWYDSAGASGAAYLYTFSNAAPLIISAATVAVATNSGTTLFVDASGHVGIGTTSPTCSLSVNGTIRAKEVVVDTGWSDYVFDKDYRLAPLSEVETRIKADKHLPGIPSEGEVAGRGVSVGEMQARLLAKIEELTLHLIAQEKAIDELRRENAGIRAQLAGASPPAVAALASAR